MEPGALARYEALADRIFRIEFVSYERHLAWLFAQCRGDWIMRLDGDEVPSRALLKRLPDMLSSRHIHQFWTANAWVFPDGKSFLGELPWSVDFVTRLMRNDGSLRLRGLPHLHAEPVTPREYVEEPFYHLDLLTSDANERRDKAVRYEAARPGLTAAGGGRINEAFYLPELRDSLVLCDVPREDRDAIERALSTHEPSPEQADPSGSRNSIPLVTLAEMDSHWEGRRVQESAYSARIQGPRGTLSLTPSERVEILVRVSNDGTERWPASLEEHPQIRLSYRWLHADGELPTNEGPRSPFSRPVAPGESILTPLEVHAPLQPGDYELQVDLVHEHCRWFGCESLVPVRVGPPAGLPDVGIRLRETPPRHRRWRRRLRIPRLIHRVWLGESPMPPTHESFGKTFASHHPGWDMRLWTDEDLVSLDITEANRARARSPSELSNLVRYEILNRFGGIYVDTDVECRRPLTSLLRGVDAFAALESPGRVGTAVLGAVPGHPAFSRAARLTRHTLGVGPHSADANGPRLLSLILEQAGDVTIFGAQHFYPYSWDELDRHEESFPDAYAVHRWALSWIGGPTG